MVISILNQKGGSGKTTIAINLAMAFLRSGHKTLLVDSDPQGSARDWSETNGGTLIPVVGLDRETLPSDLNAIKTGYETIIIDGAPQLAKLAAAAIRASSVVLIPVQPSPFDVWACEGLVDLIKQRQEITGGSPRTAFVISRAINNTRLTREIGKILEGYELPIFKSYTCQRINYAVTAARGASVLDDHVADKSKHEILGILNELNSFITCDALIDAA